MVEDRITPNPSLAKRGVSQLPPLLKEVPVGRRILLLMVLCLIMFKIFGKRLDVVWFAIKCYFFHT